jgi:hypothetical protein
MLQNSQLGCQAHDARCQTVSKRPILMTPQFLVPEGSRLMGNGKAEFQQYRTLTSLKQYCNSSCFHRKWKGEYCQPNYKKV